MSPNINNLSPSQIKRLENLAKVLDGGDVALIEQIFDIQEEVEQKMLEIQSKLDQFTARITTVRDGKDGKDGENGRDGRDGIDGKDGRDGRDGKDGKDGKDGEMGVVDEATIAYLEDKITKIEKEITRSRYMRDNIGFVIRGIVAGSNITIDNSNPEYPVINSTGGGGGTGIGTMIIGSTFTVT